MDSVQQDNVKKQLDRVQKDARLARSSHAFFVGTEDGRELLKELAIQSGANHSAFSAKDNFNPNGAAYRDGMRSTYLIIQNLINNHD